MDPKVAKLVARAEGIVLTKSKRDPAEAYKIAHAFAVLFWNEEGFDAPNFLKKVTAS
jgi:hypothetical protein